jgi:diguanylate cyclase (GGDEF)-like protein
MQSTAHSWPVPPAPGVGAGADPELQRLLLAWTLENLAAAQECIVELRTRLAQLEGLAVTDELTRLLNRRGFLAQLSRALDAARSGGRPGVVMMCDLDGFKAINDRLGHDAGNRVLRDLPASLIRQVRRTDAVGRLGGDEFGFLLAGATLTGAARKAEALQRTVERLALSVDGRTLPLSASFGLVAYDGSETEEALLHQADMAMYQEKRRRLPRLAISG